MNISFLNKKIKYIFIFFSTIIFSSCFFFDPVSILFASDVDYRFDENNKLKNIDSPVLGNNFRFLVITDTHYMDKNLNYFKKIEEIKTSLNIDFVIINGDITQAGLKEQYEIVKSDMDNCNLPIYKVLGNHDIYNNGYENYKLFFGRSHYFLEFQKTLIVILDTGNGILGEKQKKWLSDLLKNKKKENIIIFSHYSPFDFLLQSFTNMPYPEETYFITNLCEKFNVDYFISGHLHKFDHKIIKNTNYIIVANTESDDYDAIIISINDNKIGFEKIQNLF